MLKQQNITKETGHEKGRTEQQKEVKCQQNESEEQSTSEKTEQRWEIIEHQKIRK